MIISVAKATEAAGVLGVSLEGLTPTALGKAYRTKALDCHPDSHDNPELWARVSWAKEVLVRWLERQPAAVESEEASKGDCRACGGTGRVGGVQRGFGKPLTMQCVMCQGSGNVVEGQRGFYGGGE